MYLRVGDEYCHEPCLHSNQVCTHDQAVRGGQGFLPGVGACGYNSVLPNDCETVDMKFHVYYSKVCDLDALMYKRFYSQDKLCIFLAGVHWFRRCPSFGIWSLVAHFEGPYASGFYWEPSLSVFVCWVSEHGEVSEAADDYNLLEI